MEAKDRNGNDPAYPILEFNPQIKSLELSSTGMSKRELIAAMCLQGLLSNSVYAEMMFEKIPAKEQSVFVCEIAIEQADELLKQLSNGN